MLASHSVCSCHHQPIGPGFHPQWIMLWSWWTQSFFFGGGGVSNLSAYLQQLHLLTPLLHDLFPGCFFCSSLFLPDIAWLWAAKVQFFRPPWFPLHFSCCSFPFLSASCYSPGWRLMATSGCWWAMVLVMTTVMSMHSDDCLHWRCWLQKKVRCCGGGWNWWWWMVTWTISDSSGGGTDWRRSNNMILDGSLVLGKMRGVREEHRSLFPLMKNGWKLGVAFE